MKNSNSSCGGGFLSMLAVAFIVLRLCGVIAWPWIWVLAPVWIPLAIVFFVALWMAIKKQEGKHG